MRIRPPRRLSPRLRARPAGPGAWLAAAALLLAGAAGPASGDDAPTARGPQDPDDIRGVEVRGRHADDVARSVVDGVLYLPRLAVHGVLYSSGFGIEATKNARLIARSRDLLLFLDRGGVYPRVALSSESFPALGGNLFYRGTTFGVDAGGAYSNEDFWVSSAHVSWQRPFGDRVVKVTVSGEADRLDDLEFHGIGAHPASDPRNGSLPGAGEESVLYLQRRRAANVVVGVRTGGNVELFLDTLLRKRETALPDDAAAGAFLVDGDSYQLYGELSARWDTRPYAGIISPGVRAQAYAGLSEGRKSDRSRFARTGADVSAFVPVIRHNRIIVLRGALDTIRNLRDEVDIPFTEYPRHLTFRGTSSSHTILRTDEVVLVPSAAYQWPLSENLGAQLFVDGLLVAKRTADLSLSGAPWAAGLALEVHTRHHGLGRFSVSGGSEGGRIGVDLGGPIADNDRSRWR